MSIRKFVLIENVGRLAKCAQKGPELNRFNLIFGENGRGKTTLCAVMRSLETGQHEHITERKTLSPTAGDPVAIIRLSVGDVRYSKQAWGLTAPEVTIFDATFVAHNVHAGEYVDCDHRSNLLQVIIGEAGVQLANKVTSLDAAIREKNSEITRSKRAVESHIPKGVNLDVFLAIAEDDDIDAKIASKEQELKTAKKIETITKRAALTEIPVPALPANLMTVLSKTLADISAEAEQRLKEQITCHEMHDQGEAWISEGLDYLKDDNCPFCGQNVAGLELVEAYNQYFSQSYSDLIAEIKSVAAELEASFGDAAIGKIDHMIAANTAGVEFWQHHIKADLPAIEHDSDIVIPASALLKAAKSMLKAKQSQPLEAVAPGEEFEVALTAWQQAAGALAAYNCEVKMVNGAVAAKKEEAAKADAAKIEKELARLKCVKLRFDKKVKSLCDEHLTLVADKNKLDEEKNAAKNALDTHADKIIGEYETTIDKLLKGFGAGFTITNSRKTYVGGTPTSVYQILINEHPVDLGDGATAVGTPSFRTTLSAGDKSTLALAFFLAKLDHDPNKADRIIVFDDPFNSQDRSRRERTAELLKKYGSDCKQLILLSHDPFFLKLVHSKLPKKETHCVQLSRVPDNNTTIEEWLFQRACCA